MVVGLSVKQQPFVSSQSIFLGKNTVDSDSSFGSLCECWETAGI